MKSCSFIPFHVPWKCQRLTNVARCWNFARSWDVTGLGYCYETSANVITRKVTSMPIEYLILKRSISDIENKPLNCTKLNFSTPQAVMVGAAVVVNLSYVAIIVSRIGWEQHEIKWSNYFMVEIAKLLVTKLFIQKGYCNYITVCFQGYLGFIFILLCCLNSVEKTSSQAAFCSIGGHHWGSLSQMRLFRFHV